MSPADQEALRGMDLAVATIRDCLGNAAAAAPSNTELQHQLQIISDLCALHVQLRCMMED